MTATEAMIATALAKANECRVLLHESAQRQAIASEIYHLKSLGKTSEQIIDALLTKPRVVNPQY